MYLKIYKYRFCETTYTACLTLAYTITAINSDLCAKLINNLPLIIEFTISFDSPILNSVEGSQSTSAISPTLCPKMKDI